jgi:hypothetical protein
MISDQIPLLGISVWFIVKIMFLIAIAVYDMFALVVLRQTQIMTDTLDMGYEAPVRFIAIIHLLIAFGVFALALVVL